MPADQRSLGRVDLNTEMNLDWKAVSSVKFASRFLTIEISTWEKAVHNIITTKSKVTVCGGFRLVAAFNC